MPQEKYSLKWHTYSDHLKNMMKELMMNEDFYDVTLVTEDKKHMKANMNILSSCSPVFKDILKKDKNSSPTIYLRGVQHSEMESILQFIYLGEATFYEERMSEFLSVAKSLEIKELSNAEKESINELVDDPSSSDPVISTKNFEEHTYLSVVQAYTRYVQATQEGQRKVFEGVKNACDQCDYQTKTQNNLNRHIQSMHDGIKYACNQCDYQATRQDNLKQHIQSRHNGVKYACDQCAYQAIYQGDLTKHIQSMHEGIKYACDQCNYKASWKHMLNSHKKANH